MRLSLIDRYLVRSIAVPLLGTLILAAMLLVLEKMLRLFDFVVTAGGPVSVVWRMLANLLPEYFSLGIPIGGEGDDFFWAHELFISSKDSKAAQGQLTGRHHLAFQAPHRAAVDAFYQAAMEAGGKDNGPPGERPHYHPGYYAAFALDPDGNNIEAVHHGEAKRSADSVTITF